MKKNLLFVVFSLCIFQFVSGEFIVPPLPSNPIYDEVGLLSAEEKSALETKILSLEQESHHQIGIAIIKSLQGRTPEEASIKIARTWQIGQKGLDNGLLIMMMPVEEPGKRDTRIEVGYGLEGVMTDLMSKRIIDENFTPNFKTGNYAAGLGEGIDRMTPLLRGEVVELPKNPTDSFGALVTLLFWLVWGGVFLGSALFEPSKAWWPGIVFGGILGGMIMWFVAGTVLMVLVGIILSGGVLGGLDFAFSKGIMKSLNSRPNGGRWGGGGGFGGGSSGGGWGGFGGGGFGGGGASGKW